MSQRRTGTVKWFSNGRGYGFITGDDGKDIFVHFPDIQMDGFKTLRKGEKVEYDVRPGPKGPRATQVTRK